MDGPVRVQVTKADIRSGKGFLEGQPVPCPVVLALQRALGRPAAIGEFIVVGEGSFGEERHAIPPVVVDWIVRFDAGLKPPPFSFEWPPAER